MTEKDQQATLSRPVNHPFDLIEKNERDLFSKLSREQDFSSHFILTNFRSASEDRIQSIKYNELETITNHCFPNLMNQLPLHQEEEWGFPLCQAVKFLKKNLSY